MKEKEELKHIPARWICLLIGLSIMAFGVSIEVMAKLVTTPGEGMVLTICKVLPIKFGNMKVVFDTTLVCLSIFVSVLCLGHLEGVREGTIAAAIGVGLFTKQFNKPVSKFEQQFL